MANKNFEIKNGLDVGNGLINASSGDVSIRRGMSTTNRIRIASANIYADTNLTVAGNLTVNGTTTTLNTATLDVEDKNITLNKGSGDTSGSADGAGITIQDAVDASTDATLLWNASTDNFEFSHGLRMDNASHILLERGGEVRSLDTSSATKTITRVNGSNELEFGWSSSGPVKFMGGGSYTERMRIHTNANIGIGDADPVSKLTVTGPRILVQRTNDDASISFANNATGSVSGPTWSIGRNYSNSEALTFAYHASSIPSLESSVAVIKTNGFLGLGTTNPLDLIHIKSSTTDARQVIDGHTGYDAELKYAVNGTVKYTTGYDSATDKFVIGTTNVDSSPRMTINSSGFVNFPGTASVTGKFAVLNAGVHGSYDFYNNGTTYLNGAAIVDDHLQVTGSNAQLTVSGKGYFGSVGTGQGDSKSNMQTNAVLQLKPHDSNSTNMTFAQVNGGNGIGIQVSNGPQTANWEIALNPYGGNVGIGTVDPAALLEISGTGDAIRVESTNSGAGGAQMDLLHFSASPADEDTHGAINFGGYYSGSSSAYGSAIRSIWTDVSGRESRLEFLTRDDSNFNSHLTIRHDGNVVIGNSTDERLTIGHTGTPGTNSSNWIRAGNGVDMMYNAASGDHRWEIAGTQHMILKASQSDTTAMLRLDDTHPWIDLVAPDGANWKGGITVRGGSSSTQAQVHFHMTRNSSYRTLSTAGDYDAYIDTTTANAAAYGDFLIGTDNVEALRVHASGQEVSIGNSSKIGSSAKTYLAVGSLSGSSTISICSSTSGYGYLNFADGASGAGADPGYMRYNHNDNTFYFNRNVSGPSFSSDISKKENVVDIADGWSVIKDLKPRTFDWKKDERTNDYLHGMGKGAAGFIAQEVETVLPNEVHGEDGEKGISPMGIIAHLVKTVQELEARIKELEG